MSGSLSVLVGLSPTSFVVPISSHLQRISSNFSLFLHGTFCVLGLRVRTWFRLDSFQLPWAWEYTSLYSSTRTTVACSLPPINSSGLLEVRYLWYSKRVIGSAALRLICVVSPWHLIHEHAMLPQFPSCSKCCHESSSLIFSEVASDHTLVCCRRQLAGISHSSFR